MKNKKRPISDIYLDLEVLLDEMIDGHGVQWGDILFWIWGHLMIHRPDAREEYVKEGEHPEFYYGPKGGLK